MNVRNVIVNSDRFGDHALVCAHGNGRIYRHDMLCKELYNDFNKLDYVVELEPLDLLRKNNKYRPADVKVGNFLNGNEYWLDIGITGTNYESNSNKEILKNNVVVYEKNKIKKYIDEMKDLSDEQIYFPLIIQENGIINDKFNIVLNKLAKSASQKYDKIKSVMKSFYTERYSALLNKYNSYSIIQHMNL